MNKPHLFIPLLFLCVTAAPVAATLPDPTRPPDYTATTFVLEPAQKEEMEFNLTAVRIADDTRSVIINGKLVKVGDQIGSAEVLEIHPAHVVLNYDNRRMIVRLYGGFRKTISDSGNKMKITN